MKLQDSLRRGLSKVTNAMDDLVFGSAFKNLTPKVIIGNRDPSRNAIKSWETARDIGGSSYCSYSDDNNLIFKGEVVFDETISQKSRTIGGYVALRGLFESSIDLRDYSGVEVSMRSNVPMILTLNMGCESHFVNDIFQFHLQVSNTSWQKYQIRFDNFV
jgi:Complex I intermediate-associated protein 30 (CIA30)